MNACKIKEQKLDVDASDVVATAVVPVPLAANNVLEGRKALNCRLQGESIFPLYDPSTHIANDDRGPFHTLAFQQYLHHRLIRHPPAGTDQ